VIGNITCSLVVEKGNDQDIGKRFALRTEPLLIGRFSQENKPDIILHDEYTSRRHAEISYQPDCYRILDLNSTNGTTIDRERLIPGKYYSLKHGSTIGIGIAPGGERVILRFIESPASSTLPINELSLRDDNFVSWLRINEDTGEIWIDGKRLILPRKEYNLILCLHNNAGKVCWKDDLIAKVWPEVVDASGVSDAAVDQLIHRLRLKIEPDPSQPVRLISRKGFGYLLV
jgi:pSer/pThr/pTyr-binding forkhead associated (FHA) protein